MNKIIGQGVLLSYHNFSGEFITHIDAIKTQIGWKISQNGNPIVFYLPKLAPRKINYTTT